LLALSKSHLLTRHGTERESLALPILERTAMNYTLLIYQTPADFKEQLGGFLIIDVPDLDAALDWAARCPVGPGVEVRPNLPPIS
jgi:hypothetical protein